MRRVLLTAANKKAVLAALPTWEPQTVRRTQLEAVAAAFGVRGTDAYLTVLHLDTLRALGPDAPLVWKGGTALQTHLGPTMQRVSVDLDFNSTTGQVEFLRESIQDANRRLLAEGSIIEIENIAYGRLFEAEHRPPHQTIEFRRVLPTPFDETVEIKAGTFPGQREAIRIQGRLSRIQIDYGHHALPAMHADLVAVDFFTGEALRPSAPVSVNRASLEDLTADKVLATTRHDGFGRERFKDLYDLTVIRHRAGVDLTTVHENLARIVGLDRVETIVEGTLETLRILGVETANAQGFKHTVCRGGKRLVERWDAEIEATAEWLRGLLPT